MSALHFLQTMDSKSLTIDPNHFEAQLTRAAQSHTSLVDLMPPLVTAPVPIQPRHVPALTPPTHTPRLSYETALAQCLIMTARLICLLILGR